MITTADGHQALCSLDPNKAIGPDGVSPKVLKYCADVLCQPIRYLFQSTITNGHVPTEWHTHCVVPIFKSGDRAAISNYCPISLLCIISKVLEKIIFNVLISDSFSPCQFGFYLTDPQYTVLVNNIAFLIHYRFYLGSLKEVS